jgi:hypothetical protein
VNPGIFISSLLLIGYAKVLSGLQVGKKPAPAR